MTIEILNLPVDHLPGLSPGRRDILKRLDIQTVGHLLFHFPRAYEDLRERHRIAQLVPELIQTVEGEIVSIRKQSRDGRPIITMFLSDGSSERLEGVWYGQAVIAQKHRLGQRVSFSGVPQRKRSRETSPLCQWRMINPRIQPLDGPNSEKTSGIVPIYPLTEELRPSALRLLINKALDLYSERLDEIIPSMIRERHGWPGIAVALRSIHEPRDLNEVQLARQRFAYQALLELQVALALRRREVWQGPTAPRLAVTPLIDERIRKLFPFALTGDQKKAIAQVVADLTGPRPMQRLIQADVGAGKTAIAVYALLVAVANRYQAALMAPTEVLARQHAVTLDRYLSGSRVRRLLLTGSLSGRERREGLAALVSGEIDLVVGTQALLQETVRFARLGLVVIDEQHKFGVHQRARVRQLGREPHYLIMTATPIPRTVALTVFGDLDVTLVREMPAGRQPISTRWPREEQREAIFGEFVQSLQEGRQGYVVCPVVEKTEGMRSAESMYKELVAGPLRAFRVGLLHGRMDDAVKLDVMTRFRDREIDVLVCTTVVEVGVDVPNATWLIVEHAERFGLSQLHQLRGRVGRGNLPGTCVLFGEPTSDEGRQRLRTMLQTADGFTLAEEDARLRGTGDVFGGRQHGTGELWLLAQARMDLLERAHSDARELVAAGLLEHSALRASVIARYGAALELAGVG